MTAPREAGDPLPPELIKEMRERAGLSQADFATRLGLKGRRGTVSAWEQGTNPCDGPAAELILRLFPPDPSFAALQDLRTKAENIWARTGKPATPYRQLSFSASHPDEISAAEISGLYGKTALVGAGVEAFPFNSISGRRYATATIEGWTAVLPPDLDAPPLYLWLLDRRGRFLHRYHCYEASDPARFPWGNLGIGFLLRLAVQAAFYVSRLLRHLGVPETDELVANYALVGAEGRGFLFEPMNADFIRVPPAAVAGAHTLDAQMTWKVAEIHQDPLAAAISLTGELVARLDLGAASAERLQAHLRLLHEHDRTRMNGSRELAFLDDRFPKNGSGGR